MPSKWMKACFKTLKILIWMTTMMIQTSIQTTFPKIAPSDMNDNDWDIVNNWKSFQRWSVAGKFENVMSECREKNKKMHLCLLLLKCFITIVHSWIFYFKKKLCLLVPYVFIFFPYQSWCINKHLSTRSIKKKKKCGCHQRREAKGFFFSDEIELQFKWLVRH